MLGYINTIKTKEVLEDFFRSSRELLGYHLVQNRTFYDTFKNSSSFYTMITYFEGISTAKHSIESFKKDFTRQGEGVWQNKWQSVICEVGRRKVWCQTFEKIIVSIFL